MTSAVARHSATRAALPPLGAMVGAWDSGLETRMSTSSAGLLAVRVAVAAARRRAGEDLNDRDREALKEVRRDLEGEVRVLRGQDLPDVTHESSFAFAGLALSALSTPRSENAGMNEADDSQNAAARLDELARDLEIVADRPEVEDAVLERVESVFLRASQLVSQSLGRTGEIVDGLPESPGATKQWS